MNPIAGRFFTLLCFILLILSLFSLTGLRPTEPEYYAALLSTIILLVILTIIIVDVRRQVRRELPR